jgi:predicted nucleotide-binding protein
MPTAKPALFIGSSTETLPVANVLQAQLKHDATINVWNQGVFRLSDYRLDRLLRATKEFDFAAFVIGDDTLKMRGKRYLVARDNVV